MVFSSVPVYLDPPNWQQQPTHQQPGVIINSENHHNPQLPPPAPGGVGGGAGSIRPGPMTERARLAKIPQPEAALKCPRCESPNTKFCYFNNYSLTQPRHFCKTCRRYWTRGGALRNVPVGGGCRRNKRSKGSNRSKSPSVVSDRQTGSSSSSATLASNSCTDMLGHMNPAVPPQLPILPPLHHLGDYNSGDIGINFGGIQAQVAATGVGTSGCNMNFQIGTSSSGGESVLTNGLLEQWRLQQVQQFPFSTSLEPPTGLYPFEGQGEGDEAPSYGGQHQLRSKPLESTITQLAAVKMEEAQGLNLSRNFLGISASDQYWGGASGNAWTDLSGFTSSSTTHFL